MDHDSWNEHHAASGGSDSGMSCGNSPGPSSSSPDTHPEDDDTQHDGTISPKGRESPLDFSIKKISQMSPAEPSKPGTGRSAFEAVPGTLPTGLMPSGLPPHPSSIPGALPQFFNPMLAQLFPSLNPMTSPLLAHLNAGSLPIATDQKDGKNPRPFKAYNPTDPLSALQINGNLPGTNLDLMVHYRQYLLNAQATAQRVKNHSELMQNRSVPGSTTPSPNQVTSTSHPHTENASPVKPSSNGQQLPLASTVPLACAPKIEFDRTDTPTQDSQRKRSVGRVLPEELKDKAYWERRRKNNEAAKRSRDTRRQKEDEIAMRAAMLEQENLRLRIEVAQLKTETEKLRQMLLNA